jgi:predicted dehydrogenase
MKQKKTLTRKDFLKRTGTVTAAVMLSPLAARTLHAMQPIEKIRIGIIGCGSVSGVYLPHLSQCPYAELVSTCDIIYERAKQRAAEFNIPNFYPHIDQMLSGAGFDLLVNLTDMQEHGRLNRQALLAGKHVWSEKPMANTYD